MIATISIWAEFFLQLEGQFKTGKLGGYTATMSELWSAALAA